MDNEKYDLKKELKNNYNIKNTKWELYSISPQQFLMFDGKGDPNTSSEYKMAVESLYPLAYGIKFYSKNTLGKDFVVGPLEGLWEKNQSGYRLDKSKFSWTSMISIPYWIDEKIFRELQEITNKKKPDLKINQIRLEKVEEGLSAQILHFGSYDEEAPKLEYLHETFLSENGLEPTLRHHEIYLSDVRRVEPAKLKTIIRQPVRKI